MILYITRERMVQLHAAIGARELPPSGTLKCRVYGLRSGIRIYMSLFARSR